MIWLILTLALILRLINLNQSLWFDEAINVVYAKSSDIWWFATKYPVGDFHPPGWFAILWLWGHLFGFSENIVRLPSVFLGLGTVGLTYLLGKDLFGRKVGLLASLLLAIAPLHVYYSQEARMYALAAFAVILSFYFLNRLTAGKKWSWLGLVISLVLVLYSDYLAYLVIPAQVIYLVWISKLTRRILAGYLAAAIILLPWLNIFPQQLQTGMNKFISLPGWGQVVGGSNIKDLLLIPLKIIFGKVTLLNKTLYAIISALAGVIFGSIFLYGFKKGDQSMKLLISWIFIPLLLAFLISFIIPVLSYFRMLFILPAFYIVLAKSLESLSKKIAGAGLVFICLVSIFSLTAYYLDSRFQREDWRGAISFVSQKVDNRTLVVFENDEIPAPVIYYSSNLSNFKPGLSDNLQTHLVNKDKIFLFEYLVDIYDPKRIVEQELQRMDFTVVTTYNFNGVGFVREFGKQ